MNTTEIYTGLSQKDILSLRSLEILATEMTKEDLIQLAMLERKMAILYRDQYLSILLNGDPFNGLNNLESSADEMEYIENAGDFDDPTEAW